jgi:predicted outer membrane protein
MRLLVCFLAFTQLATAALAQSTTRQGGSPETTHHGRDSATALGTHGIHNSQLNSHEEEIALTLLLGNQEEVALAQFAKQKSQNSQIKEFAAMMIKDHQPAVEKLRMLSAGSTASAAQGSAESTSIPNSAVNQSPHSSPSRAGQVSGETTISQGNAAQTISPSSASVPRVNVGEHFHRLAAERCLALTVEDLNQLDNEEFDKAYVGQQIVAHVQMLAKLEAAEGLTSGPLKEFVSEAIPTVKHHLLMAKQVKDQLNATSESTGGSTARRPTTSSGSQSDR